MTETEIAEQPVALRAISLATAIESKAGRIMFAPGGVHTIHCGLGDSAGAIVTVKVDKASAAVLNASLADNNTRFAPQRSLFDKEHEGKEAMAWPTGFQWSENPKPGVYATAEYSTLGAQYVDGKVMRAFSGSFYTDADLPKRKEIKAGQTYTPAKGKRGSPENPARITALDFPYAGTLTNNPAFRANLPLWAKSRDQGPGAGHGSQSRASNQNNKAINMKKTKAELQADIEKLEQDIVALKAKDQSDAQVAEDLEKAEWDLDRTKDHLEIVELKARNEELQGNEIGRREEDAEAAVKAAVKRGALPVKDEALQAKWKKRCTENPEDLQLLAAIPGSQALQRQRITLPPGSIKIQREDSQSVLASYANEKNPVLRAALYKTEIRKRLDEGDPLPLRAGNNVGTLAGTLVTQRTLELLKLSFPVLTSISTDFSDQQSRLNQTVDSRIVSIPDVQDYDPVNGWPDSDAITVDVPVTLNKQKGVPITFTSDVLSSTVRRLFDEFGPAQSYALAKSMVDALYALFTAANYPSDPIVAAQIDFGRPTLIDGGVALDTRGVPDGPMNRFCLLNALYFGQLKKDPAIVSLSAFQDKAIIEQGVLPDVEGFRVIKAVNLPAAGNLVGFGGSKSSCVMAARLDSDYTTILPGASYGNVTTVTDPDLGLSVLQVQYVNHQKASATQRISLIFGVAKGQPNAGQRYTKQ